MMANGSVVDLQGVYLGYTTRKAFFRHTEFMALKDISFSIEKGETLGIIGANGSGKSSLLRVIAGIYRPDQGTVSWHCSKISLLSLSLGFDAQLSGRENILISGMFLGARKREVADKMTAIIAFSELGSKIDEPLKTYSSGMRARLGFSIALEMHAELLLVDEVLGVGDGKFRKKAQAAMINKIGSDQTVVFVSHAMDHVRQLCNRIVWLHEGNVRRIGPPEDTISEYEAYIAQEQ
jgi:lipopolysaccharide transport system ATP-binding protein